MFKAPWKQGPKVNQALGCQPPGHQGFSTDHHQLQLPRQGKLKYTLTPFGLRARGHTKKISMWGKLGGCGKMQRGENTATLGASLNASVPWPTFSQTLTWTDGLPSPHSTPNPSCLDGRGTTTHYSGKGTETRAGGVHFTVRNVQYPSARVHPEHEGSGWSSMSPTDPLFHSKCGRERKAQCFK